MKKQLPRFLLLFFAAVYGFTGKAQNFTALYDFGSLTNTSGRTDPTPVPTVDGITFGSFSATTTLSTNSSAGGRFSFTNWPTGATAGSNTFTGSIDLGKYYEVTLTPQTYYTYTLDSISFTVQRSGTGVRQFAVRSSKDNYATNLDGIIRPGNANLQVVAGNVFQIAEVTTAQDGTKIILSGLSDLSAPITFRFYGFNAQATGGTFSIDNVRFFGSTTLSPDAPSITLSPTALVFPSTAVGSSSVLSYTVQGSSNLLGPVTITATAPYSVSNDINGTFTSSLSIPVADVQSPKTIYVKFSPTATGAFAASISHTSQSATTKNLSVSGQGIDPTNLVFTFNSCTNAGAPGNGFTTYSVSGPQIWTCTTFGHNSTNGVNMNGYSGGPQENEDWLISPPLTISSLNLPVLRFWSRGEFSGPSLHLLVSTDYSGTGDPNLATWTDLAANFPPLTNTWTLTDGINLSAYKAAAKIYVAFKYVSTVDDGAARWTVDDVDVTDRSTLLTVYPTSLGFGEATVNTVSTGSRFSLQALGYGDITVTAPAQFQVSTDSLTGYTSSLIIPDATAQAGIVLFARFAPTTKALNVTGAIKFSGTGLDSNVVYLSGTSYPKAETFDVGCYNLSFFGSTSSNNPTPEKIATQKANIATVLKRLNLDVVGVEEISNDTAFASMVNLLPNRKAVVSDRWSYSFDPPDPAFPAQKTGFIYDSTTVELLEARDMFVSFYDSVRNGYPEKLPNYPGGTPQSFWASGRLPFMATFKVTINGTTQQVRVIDIHAKSASDVASYNRRVYDAQVLKDSLDAYYSTDKIIIVGDFNDRVFGTIYGGSGATSPYKPFVDDNADYTALTYPLDQAGRVSFISGTGLIDQIVVSNELNSLYISGSTDIEDPRSYISGYSATTASDHLPVYARFLFSTTLLPVTFTNFKAVPKNKTVQLTWSTASEFNNNYFVVERSADGSAFSTLTMVKGKGNSATIQDYQFTDDHPLAGKNYYRIRQVDLDGKQTVSRIAVVNLSGATLQFTLYPNPVTTSLRIITSSPDATVYTASIMAQSGTLLLQTTGTISQLNEQLSKQLSGLAKGLYLLRLENKTERFSQKFVKQ